MKRIFLTIPIIPLLFASCASSTPPAPTPEPAYVAPAPTHQDKEIAAPPAK